MQCSNCKTELEPNATVCPYCRMPVNVLPNTPTEPVLPKDQGMDFTSSLNVVNNNQNINNGANIEMPKQNVEMSNFNNNIEMPKPSNVPIQNNPNLINDNKMEVPVNNTVLNTEPVLPTAEEQINNNGKISEFDAAPVIDAKKKKLNLKVLVIVLIVLGVLGGTGYFLYHKEFQTNSNRIGSVIDTLFSKINQYTNDSIELGNGDYTLNASLNYNDIKYSTNITGKYAYDLNNKILDITSNVNNLTIKNEEVIGENPLSNEVYLYNNVVYLLFQNFLEEYIYGNLEEIPDEVKTLSNSLYNEDTTKLVENLNKVDYKFIGDSFNSISQNDINYLTVVSMFKTALKNSLSADAVKTSVGKSDISDNKLVNIINVNLNENGQKIFIRTLLNNITNNQTMMNELIKLTGLTSEQLQNKLKFDDSKYKTLGNINIYIYTKLFDNSFVGIKATKDQDKIIILPISNGYSLNYKSNNVNILDLKYTTTYNFASTTKETIRDISYNYYKDKVAYKGDINLSMVRKLNSEVNKVNTKNSVKYNNLSIDNYLSLEKGIKSYGKLGLLLNDKITYKPTVNGCETVTNCLTNEEGKLVCDCCNTVTGADGVTSNSCTNMVLN